MKLFIFILLGLALASVIVIAAINLRVGSDSEDRIYREINDVPDDRPVAIVLGARVADDGSPSNTLYDRTLTGVELYKAGKVKRLLLSGGNSEPDVMKRVAFDLGVPATDIELDAEGIRTYESCLRAKNVFGIDRAVIVTQDYHLARSLYLCSELGIDAIGVDAKRRDYDGERFHWIREYFARVKAWSDINMR